ncbi:hypothetical protein POM88_039966 [Heracleum sosnowskyi]|uniref:Uncharacterized protein n=1 Tax=Heracleum sosnowskyi TaxID=360622 RepID=A0AAD8HE39_9APIA|nr:hypothetical protein POM88_039966 [Heracleum sosnowskyi]
MNGIHPMIMNQLPYPMMATRSGAMIRREKLWHLFKQGFVDVEHRHSPSVGIGHSLHHLPYLSYVDCSSNMLAGIPEFIGSITNIVHLDLSDTLMEGLFSEQIGNHSNFQCLNLRPWP